jgi:methylmalonyl-CoA/ethylmalonyl-CoA epimerase
MNDKYRFHHMGVATRNIEKSAAAYANLGYSRSETIVEPSQNVKICFLTRPGSPAIELVEPLTADAPVSRFVQSGTTPYHTCWEVDDIYQSIEELEDLNFRLMFEPLVSEAMDKGLFCYLFSVDIGLFELYQRKAVENS